MGIAVPFPATQPPGYDWFDDEPVFDPDRHLQLEEPAEILVRNSRSLVDHLDLDPIAADPCSHGHRSRSVSAGVGQQVLDGVLDEATVFEWTERSVWHGSRSATYAENGTRVTVTWPDFEMTFDLERGLPTSARVPKTSTGGRVEARTVAPRWTADTWRERIRSEFEVGKDLAPDPAAWRQALRGGFLADLLRDVLPQVPPAERTRETMKRLASTIVVPLAASGASGSTHAWEPDGSSEGGALRAGAAASTQARYAGWNEVASFEFGLLVREAYLAARDRLPPLPK